MNNTDIIIFFIVVIIVTSIVIININSIVDNKNYTSYSNSKHNEQHSIIPPIIVPAPVYRTTDKKNKSNDVEHFDTTAIIDNILKVESVKKTLNSGLITMNIIGSHANEIAQKIKADVKTDTKNLTTTIDNHLTNVKNALAANQTVSNTQNNQSNINQEMNKQTVKVMENNIGLLESDIKRIEFPDDEDIVKYDGKNEYTQPLQKNPDNSNDRMIANSVKINNVKFPICDNDCNINDDYDTDITELYRQKQIYAKSYMEDPVVRGYNVESYGGFSPLANTGLIKLEKEVKYPKPNGYIFKNSPAYNR